jgi:phosphatidylglycerol:prolipoprotein diacylglycerol transferase
VQVIVAARKLVATGPATYKSFDHRNGTRFVLAILYALPFPAIDPTLFEVGPLAIRWYALAYIAGLLLGWWYILRLVRDKASAFAVRGMQSKFVDDFFVWATAGVILGGRTGYVLFYNPAYYLVHPVEVFYVWQGGMSFHGGLLGVIAAMGLFAWHRKIGFFTIADPVACAAPIGLFFGRIANFINQELWGRVTDVPWAVVFPKAGPEPRHASQLYEAGLEGAVLFAVLWFLLRRTDASQRPGYLSGVFLLGYSVARAFVEMFRQPDPQLGFLFEGTTITMGQLLSAPMILLGVYLIIRGRRAKAG